MRRTPRAAAVSARRRLPATLTSHSNARFPRAWAMLARCMTASQPFRTSLRAAEPRPALRMSWPRAMSMVSRALPTKPELPVTATRIAADTTISLVLVVIGENRLVQIQKLRSPPAPVGAMAVSYLKYRVVAGIVEPAAKFSANQRAQAVIEDAPVPTRRTAAERRFGVGVKTRYCASSFLRSRVDGDRNQVEICPLPIEQHPAILVALPSAAIST